MSDDGEKTEVVEMPDQGLSGVAAMVADAESPSDFIGKVAANDPLPGAAMNGVVCGEWEPDELGLPPECPVLPLGYDIDHYHFIDTGGQHRSLEFTKFGQKAIGSLFMGRAHYLYWAWPRTDKSGKNVVAWKQEKVTEVLMHACARKGPFDPVERLRGRGAWTISNGDLIVHCGTYLWERGKRTGVGELDGKVYMTRPPLPKPWPEKIPETGGPAALLFPMLKTWNWARPKIDPILFLGWLAAAQIGGALPWRPVVFLTGDKATGKTTLQKLLKAVLGPVLIQSGDTTAAGIYQLMKYDALPVAIDELEAKADTRKVKAVLELARAASDNQLIMRGGESHKGVRFYARSCFLFSSINAPPLEPQDWSRLAMLRLYRLDEGAAEPTLDDGELARAGRMILRKMIDNWHRFYATFTAYKEVLAAGGHDARGQNTFGVLLACADLVIDGDAQALGLDMGPGVEDLRSWSKLMAAEALDEYENAAENWRLCMDHILSTRVDAWRSGSRRTVGQALDDFWKDKSGVKEGALDLVGVNRLLEQTGLKLRKPDNPGDGFELIVPNSHKLLFDLFEGSKWAGEPGAGVWSGALRQAPRDQWRVRSARITGRKCKATGIDLNVVLQREEGESIDD